MSLPRYVIILTQQERPASLKYIKPDKKGSQGSLQFTGTASDFSTPHIKFQVERSESRNDLVHIRSCYNNKYWRRDSENGTGIVAEAEKKEEDESKWSCTLFRATVGEANSVQLFHIQLGRSASHKTTSSFGLSLDEGEEKWFKFKDWEMLVFLPQHVAFKGDNGKYLKAYFSPNHCFHLQFSCDDAADPLVGNEIYYRTADGCVAIRNQLWNKFWRANNEWIFADADPYKNETLFNLVKVGGNAIALRPVGYKDFCKRYSLDYIAATVTNITKEAKLFVEEQVQSRFVYNVRYRLADAIIYDEERLTMATARGYNGSSSDSQIELILKYKEMTSSTWNTSLSFTMGFSVHLQAGVPLVAEAKVDVSSSFTSEYRMGETKESTKEIEAKNSATVPPKTKVTMTLVATKGRCDVPFSYTQRDILLDGTERITEVDDGVYTGLSCYNFDVDVKEEANVNV